MSRIERTDVLRSSTDERHGSTVARVATGVLLALLSAVLNVLAHPPVALGPLVLVMLVPMLVAQHNVMPRRMAGVPLAIAIAGPAWWGVQGVVPPGATAAVRIFPFVLAVMLIVLGPVDRWLMERTAYRSFVLLVPLVWTSIAFLVAYGPTGTIGTSASALHKLPHVLQPVSVVGAIGLILLTYLSNWAIAAIVLSLLGHANIDRPRALRVAIATVIVGAIWVGSSLVMMGKPDGTIRVAAIQPGQSYVRRLGSPSSEAIERYAAQTREAAARGARLVVWPETGLPFDPAKLERARLIELARTTRATIAVGYGTFDEGVRGNEAILVTPEGRLLGPYAKQHPVRFLGERSDTDHGYPVFGTDVGTIGMLICFDMDFLDTPRRMATKGAGLIAVPSNDWSEIADVHYASFVLRAIENRVSLVKADTAWDSAIIDPYGRVVAKRISPEGTRATLVADVPMGSARTIASRIGDLNAAAVAIVAVAMLAVTVIRARHNPPASD